MILFKPTDNVRRPLDQLVHYRIYHASRVFTAGTVLALEVTIITMPEYSCQLQGSASAGYDLKNAIVGGSPCLQRGKKHS